MKIRMLTEQKGSVDGIRVATYEAGKEYDLTTTSGARELAAAFVGARMAEKADAVPAPLVAPVAPELLLAAVATPAAPTKPPKAKK